MKLSLVVLTPGKMQGQVLEIKLAQFLVGRDPQCQLRPASPMISKRHCALLQRDGKAFVRDFDSTNGTFVNEQPVKGEVELSNEDKLRIGPLLFAVRLEAGAPVNRQTPPPPTRASTAAKPTTKTAKSTVSTPTPPPETTPKPAGATNGGDDDIAAMLLSLQDDGASTPGLTSNDIPDGSTVHDLTLTPDMLAAGESAADKEKAKKEAEAAKAKAATANTASAAKNILEKYMKRPRPQG
jgi:pSer/pThr/pTyr-binding forkhead associated (FHA) protein